MDKSDVKMYSIGSLHISRAALITLLVGILASVVILIVAPNAYGVMVAIYVLLVVMLVSYNINCTLLGHCKVYAWFLTIFYSVSLISSVAFFALKTLQTKGSATPSPKFSIKTFPSKKK